MKKVSILQKLQQAGVIAVVRGDSYEQGKKTAEAIVLGGIKGLEITFSVPNAEQLIATLVQNNLSSEIVVGAGTVLDAITARLAILAGASFIVSPAFDQETAEICNLYQIPYIPGCMTVTEMKTALCSGVDIVKLFPGSAFSSTMISAIKAPLPQVNIMPTGGVNENNMHEWFQAGATAVGVGGDLTKPAEIGDYQAVTEKAKSYMRVYEAVRK